MKKIIALTTIIYLLLASTITEAQVEVYKPIDYFNIGLKRKLKSELLKEQRTINIYLPEGFDANDTSKYALVILLDGGAYEHFISVSGIYQFTNVKPTNENSKSIVVGIENTDRIRDFTHPTNQNLEKNKYKTAGGAATFIQFIEKELLPYLEDNFPLTSTRTLIGEELGGLLAMDIAFNNVTLFNQYIVVSPCLWWNKGALLDAAVRKKNTNCNNTTKVYIGVGNEELVPDSIAAELSLDASTIIENLQFAICPQWQLHYDFMPTELNKTALHQGVYNALRWIQSLPPTKR